MRGAMVDSGWVWQNPGTEYAAPVSGANIQPVQLADLDGDGREEAHRGGQNRG